MDYDFANDTSTTTSTIGTDESTTGGGGYWTFDAAGGEKRRPVTSVGAITRPVAAARKSNGLPRTSQAQPGQPQPPPVLAENEQLLSSTLEELGDAVAW